MGGWEKLLQCLARKELLTYLTERENNIVTRRSHIQCKRTSFPASFASLAGRKNICHTLNAFCLPHDNATALYWQEKLTHVTECETNILTHTQDPRSV